MIVGLRYLLPACSDDPEWPSEISTISLRQVRKGRSRSRAPMPDETKNDATGKNDQAESKPDHKPPAGAETTGSVVSVKRKTSRRRLPG